MKEGSGKKVINVKVAQNWPGGQRDQGLEIVQHDHGEGYTHPDPVLNQT